MQLVVDGRVANYERRGKGPVVVLVHGWGDDLRTYSGLMPKLAENYDVVAVDLPGFGGSEAPADVWNLDNYAAFIDSFLKKNNIPKVHAFVGHSNGGAVLIRGLSLGTLTSEKLILMAASGIRPKKTAKKTAFKAVAKGGKAATFWMPASSRKKLQKMLYGAAGSDMLVVPELKETFKATVSQDVQEDAAKLVIPTLLIWGDSDRATPLQDGQQYASLIKGSRLETLPATHFVHHDQAERVFSLITEFLA